LGRLRFGEADPLHEPMEFNCRRAPLRLPVPAVAKNVSVNRKSNPVAAGGWGDLVAFQFRAEKAD
jgi:hypothetical protein